MSRVIDYTKMFIVITVLVMLGSVWKPGVDTARLKHMQYVGKSPPSAMKDGSRLLLAQVVFRSVCKCLLPNVYRLFDAQANWYSCHGSCWIPVPWTACLGMVSKLQYKIFTLKLTHMHLHAP